MNDCANLMIDQLREENEKLRKVIVDQALEALSHMGQAEEAYSNMIEHKKAADNLRQRAELSESQGELMRDALLSIARSTCACSEAPRVALEALRAAKVLSWGEEQEFSEK